MMPTGRWRWQHTVHLPTLQLHSFQAYMQSFFFACDLPGSAQHVQHPPLLLWCVHALGCTLPQHGWAVCPFCQLSSPWHFCSPRWAACAVACAEIQCSGWGCCVEANCLCIFPECLVCWCVGMSRPDCAAVAAAHIRSLCWLHVMAARVRLSCCCQTFCSLLLQEVTAESRCSALVWRAVVPHVFVPTRGARG